MNCYTIAILSVYVIMIVFIIQLEHLKEKIRLEDDIRFHKRMEDLYKRRWEGSELVRKELVKTIDILEKQVYTKDK